MNIKNKFNIKKESGRSMVEMLGVLAIVGVLSIGGIVGLQHAMKQIQNKEDMDLFNSVYLMKLDARNNPNSMLNCCTKLANSYSCAEQIPTNIRNEIRKQMMSVYIPSKYQGTASYCGAYCGSNNYYNQKVMWEFNPYSYTESYIQMSVQYPNSCKNILNAIRSDKYYQEDFIGFGVARGSHYGIKYRGLENLTDENISDVCNRMLPAVHGDRDLVIFTIYYTINGVDCEFE